MATENLRERLPGHANQAAVLPAWSRQPCKPSADVRKITQRAFDIYLLSKEPNGEIRGIGWWQSANGYTAMALHDIWSQSKKNYDVLAKALRQCERRKPGIVNEFNDDTLWWGLCSLHVYTLGGDVWFLGKAKSIWKYVQEKALLRKGQVNFRGMDMEGACYWTTKPGEEQINSITTGLFAELSVRLALLEDNSGSRNTSQDYLDFAQSSLGWILRCRYRRQDAIVLDNILVKKQEARDWTFTYTTGVTLGVCALLYEATRQDDYMDLACVMARKAMCRPAWVEENGVLTERSAYGKGNHEPWQNSDAVGFKAVLVRHLAVLYRVISRTECTDTKVLETSELIKTFINLNFQSQQERNTNGNGQYGPWWNGPFEMSTSHSQMAVLDVMAGTALVNEENSIRE